VYSLARIYASQDRFVEAEKLLLRALEGGERLLHPDTQITVKKLVSVYRVMARTDDAKMMEQRISSESSEC
jgi:hypothetical protein